jgi:hypothetical protein
MPDYKPATLLEAANRSFNEGMDRYAELILQFATGSKVLPFLPFRTIAGGSIEVQIQTSLGDVGVRRINENSVRGLGTHTKAIYSTAIHTGSIAVDRALEARMPGSTASFRRDKIQAFSLYFDRLFIKGSKESNDREYNGLQALTKDSTTQLLAAGNTSGGDALSFGKLDTLLKYVDFPTHWIMDKLFAARLSTAARNTGISGYVTFGQNELGMQQMYYAGIPILEIDEDNQANRILGFTEACPGGGTGGTSIYLVSLGDLRLQGIQVQPLQVYNKGQDSEGTANLEEIEWDAGIGVFQRKSIARLWGIKDVPIVA